MTVSYNLTVDELRLLFDIEEGKIIDKSANLVEYNGLYNNEFVQEDYGEFKLTAKGKAYMEWLGKLTWTP